MTHASRPEETETDSYSATTSSESAAGQPLVKDYRYESTPETSPGAGRVRDVYGALLEYLRDEQLPAYPTSTEIAAQRSHLSATRVGKALTDLAAADDCPLDIRRWSSRNNPRWMVQDARAVNNGGGE